MKRFFGIIIIQLVCYVALAQQPIPAKLQAYATKAMQEKLFMHTDKELYIAGEIIWFKIYYVEATSNLPMYMSKLAYVEVLNGNNEAVQQAKIALENGSGKGSFYLPAALPTGNYTLRAYTNWMKNFDAGFFFEKKITIINTLKAPDVPPSKDSSVLTVEFFPEGGSLVSGLFSKIGFFGRNKKGSSNDFRGYIIGQNNDTITSFAPLKFGIGSFWFTPQPGISYKVNIVQSDGKVTTQLLPQIFQSGYVMNVNDDGDKIKVTVKSKQGTEELLLAAHKRQVLAVAEKAYINDSVIFVIAKNKLSKGVTTLTIFNGKNQPVCERLVYLPPSSARQIDVKTDQASYSTRKKINLDLNAESALDLSVSVFYTDNLQSTDQLLINDYIWLVADLAGAVESPAYYFSNDADVKQATDNLLLTHGWRRFKWENVLQEGNTFIKYLPEINGHIVTARVRDSRDERPVPELNNFLSIPGAPFGFYTSMSDKDGIVYFETKNFYGNGQIVLQPDLGADSFYRTDIIKPFAEIYSGNKYPTYTLTEEAKDQLLKRSIGMQVQNIYTGDSLRNFYEPALNDTLPFFGLPETSYNLDDYKRFTTMEEVLREYVREVGVGIRGGDHLVFKLFNPVAHDFYNGNTLVLLNGVPLPDPDKIFTYDPLKVRRIDVIRGRYVLGPSSFNGVASFLTYDGKFAAFELEPKLVAIDYNGLQLEREFYSPAYDTKEQLEKRIPDFRNTLYWSPSVELNENGKATIPFYSSDLPGKYTVIIQGMSDKGEFINGTTSFEIK